MHFQNLNDAKPTYPNMSVFCLSSINVILIHACYDYYEDQSSFVINVVLIF